MTTNLVPRAAAAGDLESLLKRRPSPLPAAILHSERVDGFRNPQWVAHPLDGDARQAMTLCLREIEERLTPARRGMIVALLTRLAVHYPGQATDGDSFPIVLGEMADDMAEYSELHIAAACAEWRRTEKWWPKTSELREKLLFLHCTDLAMRHRAEVLLGHKPPRPFEIPAPDRSGAVFRDLTPVLDAMAREKRA